MYVFVFVLIGRLSFFYTRKDAKGTICFEVLFTFNNQLTLILIACIVLEKRRELKVLIFMYLLFFISSVIFAL